MRASAAVEMMFVYEFLLSRDLILFHLLKQAHAQLDVCDEGFATACNIGSQPSKHP